MGVEEREPGTHCSRMCQVTLLYCSATLKLWSLSIPGYTRCETHTGGFEIKSNITLTVTVYIALFEVIG